MTNKKQKKKDKKPNFKDQFFHIIYHAYKPLTDLITTLRKLEQEEGEDSPVYKKMFKGFLKHAHFLVNEDILKKYLAAIESINKVEPVPLEEHLAIIKKVEEAAKKEKEKRQG